jgi:hypothetical protein
LSVFFRITLSGKNPPASLIAISPKPCFDCISVCTGHLSLKWTTPDVFGITFQRKPRFWRRAAYLVSSRASPKVYWSKYPDEIPLKRAVRYPHLRVKNRMIRVIESTVPALPPDGKQLAASVAVSRSLAGNSCQVAAALESGSAVERITSRQQEQVHGLNPLFSNIGPLCRARPTF